MKETTVTGLEKRGTFLAEGAARAESQGASGNLQAVHLGLSKDVRVQVTRHGTRGAGRTQPVKGVTEPASRNVEGYRRIASREIVGHICSFFF